MCILLKMSSVLEGYREDPGKGPMGNPVQTSGDHVTLLDLKVSRDQFGVHDLQIFVADCPMVIPIYFT